MNKNNLVRRINLVSELASTSLPHQTLIELLDTCRVIIENHKGVCQYSCDKICVKSYYGCICISGQQLQIARMSKTQLVITGNICSITAMRERE